MDHALKEAAWAVAVLVAWTAAGPALADYSAKGITLLVPLSKAGTDAISSAGSDGYAIGIVNLPG